MEHVMERKCLRCGKGYYGRVDKKFCCDDCRTDYHNHIRRQRNKKLREVNNILAANWKILSTQIREGRYDISLRELASKRFNFEIYTASRRVFPGFRVYWCYNLAYRVTLGGKVHIFRIFEG